MGTHGIAWAWEKTLPPKEKLALLYLGDLHSGVDRPLDHEKLARFIGVGMHELPPILDALLAARLVDFAAGYWKVLDRA